MSTVNDLVPLVASLLGGRTDLNSNIAGWIVNGYQDLTSTIPFCTLELTQNSSTVANVDTYDYPSDARAIKSLTLAVNNSGSGNAPRQLRKRNIQIIDQYQTINTSVPAVWAPFANQFILRPVPDDAYPLIIRYWQTAQITGDIVSTPLLVPDDWIEIITYEAQMRGYLYLQEQDRAAAVRQILYGNPTKPGMPGLVKQRLTRIEAESSNANYGIRPRVTRYTNVR